MKKLFLMILVASAMTSCSVYSMQKGGLFGDGREYTPEQILQMATNQIAKPTETYNNNQYKYNLPRSSGRILEAMYGLHVAQEPSSDEDSFNGSFSGGNSPVVAPVRRVVQYDPRRHSFEPRALSSSGYTQTQVTKFTRENF